MAEEKTILTVDLYDNVLTEKTGDFTGKIRITGTTRTSDISNRIVKKRTEYRPETITNILDLSYDEMIEALAQGRCVVNKFGQWLLTINGSFDGKKIHEKTTFTNADPLPVGRYGLGGKDRRVHGPQGGGERG